MRSTGAHQTPKRKQAQQHRRQPGADRHRQAQHRAATTHSEIHQIVNRPDSHAVLTRRTMLLSRNPPSTNGKANSIIGSTLTEVISRDQNSAAKRSDCKPFSSRNWICRHSSNKVKFPA